MHMKLCIYSSLCINICIVPFPYIFPWSLQLAQPSNNTFSVISLAHPLILLFGFFWPRLLIRKILVPQAGIEP